MKKIYILLLFLFSLADLHSQMIAGLDVFNSQNSLLTSSAPAANCDVQLSFQTTSTSPAGLAFDGTYLYSLDSTEPLIYKYTLDGQPAGTIPFPPGTASPYFGDMDYDGTNLWLMAEQQGILYKLNPLNGDVLSSYVISTSSDPNYYACAYDNGYLWISEYYSGHKLIKVNATTGVIENTIPILGEILSLKIISGDLYGIDIYSNLVHKFDRTTGEIISSTPWCIAVNQFPRGYCVADNAIWGLSGGAINGGTQSIKRFESALLSNEYFETANNEITVLPNPASDIVQITAATSNIVGFEIFNTIGESVAGRNCDVSGRVTVDISRFQKGIYFIRVATKNGSYLKKCIKM